MPTATDDDAAGRRNPAFEAEIGALCLDQKSPPPHKEAKGMLPRYHSFERAAAPAWNPFIGGLPPKMDAPR